MVESEWIDGGSLPTPFLVSKYGLMGDELSDAHHPEILGSVGSNAAALVPVSDRLLRFPLAA